MSRAIFTLYTLYRPTATSAAAHSDELSCGDADSPLAVPATSAALLLLLLLFFFFFDPGTQFPRKEKITLCNIKKSTKIKLE